MSTKETIYREIDCLTEEQLQELLAFIRGLYAVSIPEAEPDEWDKAIIADSKVDNDESVPLDDFVRELGFDPDDLRV
jgi:hypothetical protein